MKIITTNEDGNVTVRLDGRIDSSNVHEVEREIRAQLETHPAALIIDMKDVDYLSSSGLRVLVMARKAMNGKQFAVVSPNSFVKAVMKMAGMEDLFEIR